MANRTPSSVMEFTARNRRNVSAVAGSTSTYRGSAFPSAQRQDPHHVAGENFVEPKVMSRTVDIHPLVVLVVTALGGLLGGTVGLILAVPAYVIAGNASGRLRGRGVVQRVADRAQPTVQQLLG
jgi:hypothetical protein